MHSFFLLCATATAQKSISVYVPVKDGTRLAVDVYFPNSQEDEFPVLTQFARYWRSSEDPQTGEAIPSLSQLEEYFLANGYALAIVDVRESGASFEVRPGEYTRQLT